MKLVRVLKRGCRISAVVMFGREHRDVKFVMALCFRSTINTS